MKTFLWASYFFMTLSLTSCITPIKPVSQVSPSNNKDYKVDYLFEHDGCKVYRFHDLGHYVYFTNCQGETTSFPDSTTIIKNRTERQ